MFPVAEDGRLEGVIDTDALSRYPRGEWALHTVGEAMRQDVALLSVSPNADAFQALERMQRTGANRLLVTDDGRLVGVVSRKNLMNFLALKLELEGDDDGGRTRRRRGRPNEPPCKHRPLVRRDPRGRRPGRTLVPKLCLGTHSAKLRFASGSSTGREAELRNLAFPNRVWERARGRRTRAEGDLRLMMDRSLCDRSTTTRETVNHEILRTATNSPFRSTPTNARFRRP